MTIEDFILSIIASLIAAGIGWLAGYAFRGKQYTKSMDSAPEVYIAHLDKLINDAVNASVNSIDTNAHAIVTLRDNMVKSLTNLSAVFGNEIDNLKIHNENGNHAMQKRSIAILARTLPLQKDQVTYAVGKILVDMGLREQ